MPRFAQTITKQELEQEIILLAYNKCDGRDFQCDIDYALCSLVNEIPECKFVSDLKKVNVDGENTEIEEFVSDGDLNYFLAYLGGDWQNPVYFAIYWDGKSVRSYIPDTSTNYNLDTKEAFGEDEEADIKYLNRIGIKCDEDSDFYDILKENLVELKAAIKNRIIVKE